jgi:hypothetical protein
MDNCSHVLVPSQYGGGIYFNSGTLQLSTVVFSANNAANGGLALYFVNTPDDGSFLTDIVVRDHQSGQTVAVRAGATVPWRSAPGTYPPSICHLAPCRRILTPSTPSTAPLATLEQQMT